MMDNLPPLRMVVQTHGLNARKALGQNFLFDLNLTRRIARAAGPLQNVHILEIGPGPGGLTRALLMEGAAHVTVIEQDERCLPALEEIARHYPGQITIIAGDALKQDLAVLIGQQDYPAKVVANLPYNIGTALLVSWLATPNWPPPWQSLTLMFQREVAERIVATPETRGAYGRLGVLCGWRCETKILFDVPPNAFTPPPKVTSSVVQLVPKTPLPCPLEMLETVTRTAFGQRRKMLRQSLKSLSTDIGRVLEAAGIHPTARPEQIPVKTFVRLCQLLST